MAIFNKNEGENPEPKSKVLIASLIPVIVGAIGSILYGLFLIVQSYGFWIIILTGFVFLLSSITSYLKHKTTTKAKLKQLELKLDSRERIIDKKLGSKN